MRLFALVVLAWLSTPALAASQVDVVTTDGITLKGEHDGDGARGVLLVHGQDRSRSDWTMFVRSLRSKGFSVLTLDLRAHGQSKPPDTLGEDWTPLTRDVDAGVAWLRAHGATQVAVVGDGLGANVAVNAAAANHDIDNLVLLSPGLNIKGLQTAAPLAAYGNRPVLLASGSRDAYAARTVQLLEGRAVGAKKLVWVAGATHGPEMLLDPAVEDSVLGWLENTRRSEGGTAEPGTPLHAADTTTLETEGTRFGEPKKP